MEVSLSGRRVLFSLIALFALTLISCGNRYDLSTERGRRARIDDANFHLSQGECGAAAEAINPLYSSIYVDDEVRVIKASTLACFSRFKPLTFISNMAGSSNYFQSMAKSMDSSSGDASRTWMYDAVDILTQSGAALNASARGRSVNSYMVFLQFGVISTILRNYGSPDCCNGTQGADLVYESAAANPAGEMSDLDACALAAAFSFISDSFPASDLSDTDTTGAVTTMNGICVSAGLPSCASINRVRTSCDGTNNDSDAAASVVGVVNTSW